MRYRTYVNFGWLDLMVAFGGIAGLLLGCSILSGVEIVYYILMITLMFCRKLKVRVGTLFSSHSNRSKVNDARQNNRGMCQNSENVRVIKIQPLIDVDKNVHKKNRTRF